MKRDMVDSNYLDELLEGIPDELFDGNYSEEDLLKMVDLPMESFAIDGEFDVNESHDSWQSLASFYGGCRPVDSVVWNTQIDSKPNLNCSVPLPDPILSDTSVGLPVFIEDNVMNMKHITGNTVSDTLVEVKPRRLPLNDLIMESGSILGLPQVVENQVMNHTRTRGNGVSYGMESGPMIMPMNGLISKTEPIPSAASFGLPRVGDDMAIKHTTGSVVSDTLLESKSNLIPTNWLVTKSRPMLVDATIGSPRGVECKVSNHTVGYAHTDIIPEIPANGKAKVLESGSSRIQSPVSVLDNTSSCKSCQTSMSTIKPRGARYGKRSERPRPKHIKTSWFHITLMPPAVFSKKISTNQKSEKKRKSQEIEKENKLYSFACSKKQTMASQGTKKCSHCEVTKTPQWREGPNGPKTLCNACGVRYRSGRLYPEYRPAASPTFTPILHSNSHRKVIEMRKQQTLPENKLIDTTEQDSEGMDPPRSHDSMLIENVPMIGHPFELIY